MRRMSVLVLVSLFSVGLLFAEGATSVVVHPMSVSGTKITALEKDAAAAVSTTDGILLTRTGQHSVAATVECTQTLSLTVTAYVSVDGTTYMSAGSSAVFAPTTAASSCIDALSLPVAPYLRLTLSSDATYPCTYTSVTVQSW